MKLIILDFLRRWWGGYLLAVLFVGAMLAALDLEVGFTFFSILMLPFAFELGRRPVGVMVTLPVSRRTIALSYWCAAVLLPVVLMAGIVVLDALLFRSFAVSWKSAAMILLGALALAGSGFCLFTFISQDDGEDNADNVLVICLGTLWFLFTMYGLCDQRVLNGTPKSPVFYLAGLIGLVLTVWGYSRSETLGFGHYRKHKDGWHFSVRAPRQISSRKPGTERFGGVLFNVVWRAFLAGLGVTMFIRLFGIRIEGDQSCWPFLITFSATGCAVFLSSGGLRLLRCLPLSTCHLASVLLLIPLFSVLAVVAGLAVVQLTNLGHFLNRDSATFLVPMTGAVCLASSVMVLCSGSKDVNLIGLALGLPASMVICDTVSNVKWPVALWWLLGFSLMLAAFFLNRHWLRSSYSYRPSTGGFLRRHR